jgi:hypothetical protein
VAEHKYLDILRRTIAGELGERLQYLAQQQTHKGRSHRLHRVGHARIEHVPNRGQPM